MPNRTTRDYEGPAVAPKIQAALDAALMDEDDIDLDANDIKYRTHCKRCEVTLHCCGFVLQQHFEAERQVEDEAAEEQSTGPQARTVSHCARHGAQKLSSYFYSIVSAAAL